MLGRCELGWAGGQGIKCIGSVLEMLALLCAGVFVAGDDLSPMNFLGLGLCIGGTAVYHAKRTQELTHAEDEKVRDS